MQILWRHYCKYMYHNWYRLSIEITLKRRISLMYIQLNCYRKFYHFFHLLVYAVKVRVVPVYVTNLYNSFLTIYSSIYAKRSNFFYSISFFY